MSFLALLLPLLTVALVYVLVAAPASGRSSWVTRGFLVAGAVLLTLALGMGLGANGLLNALSAVMAGVGVAFLARLREQEDNACRAREEALRKTLEETSCRVVALGARQIELEAERAHLQARATSLEEEKAELCSRLAEKERHLQALDWRLRYERSLDDLERRYQEVQELARYDGLTRLYNRRHIDRVFDALANSPDIQELAVAIFDVDHFKMINDRYGHPIGDRVLAEIAHIFRCQLRQSDLVGRYGGEEFIVLLTHAVSANDVCEKLRSAVAAYPWSEIASGLTVTISAGVATGARPFDPSALVHEADRRLYRAKESGRNRVVGAGG